MNLFQKQLLFADGKCGAELVAGHPAPPTAVSIEDFESTMRAIARKEAAMRECNYCCYQGMVKRARGKRQVVVSARHWVPSITGWVNVYLLPLGVDLSSIPDDELKQHYGGAFLALPDHCTCLEG